MAIEIERKFLLQSAAWRQQVTHTQRMRQAYLGGTRCSTRVRIGDDGAYLNIKSIALGASRLEFEYAISASDAEEMISHLADGAVIEKMRHYVPMDGLCFEIDEFFGANAGLVVAEIELPQIDTPWPKPVWLGREVTAEPAYYNLSLVSRPFNTWPSA
jgi:adenylate cyclase